MIQMYDGWVQAVESEQIAGVVMLDMSAAFDLVDHELLLHKLCQYGFEKNSLDWIKSYLDGRKQCVVINGSLSKMLPVNTGVPQGSILGPLLYTIFTNELPEIIHNQAEQVGDHHQGGVGWPAYHLAKEDSGSLCCYADDSTLTCTATRPSDLSRNLSEKYNTVAEFMRNNKLKLNDDKTHLLIMDTGQSRLRNQANKLVNIQTPTEIIKPSSKEKLLGCWVSDNMKWAEHIQDNKDNLILALTTRLGALKKISRVASFKNRKMLANGIFLSKLSYMIALWGGCGVGLRKSLQIIQNKAARFVTKLDWSSPTSTLLGQMGWLSVNQLIFYHSVLLVYKVKMSKSPMYIDNMFNWSYIYNTRQAEGGLIKIMGKPKLDVSRTNFRMRAANYYNQLPTEIRGSTTLAIFKSTVKSWIKGHVSIN